MAYPASQAAPTSAAPAASPPLDIAALMKQYLPAAPSDAAQRATAHANALSDVQSQLDAIHAAQQQALQQASQRAQSINAATLASSGYLDHLGFGERLRAAFQQAGQDQAATAQGFSGDLRQIAGGEADRVNANLASLGAPGQAPSPEAAANVVYGLGSIPANVLTASAPLALARTQALPAQLLGAGQAEAVGALGAGQTAAARYGPAITAAIGGLPKLERTYLTQLQTQAAKARQDAIGNFFKAVAAQQAGDNAAALAHWRQAQLDAGKARRDATELHNAALERQGDRRLDISQENADTSETRAKNDVTKYNNSLVPTFDAARSNSLGYRVDQFGQPLGGKITPLPRYRLNKAGTGVVKLPSAGKIAGVTPSFVKGVSAQVQKWATDVPASATYQADAPGQIKDANGKDTGFVNVPGTGHTALAYPEALARTVALGPNTAAWRQKAAQIVSSQYGGTPKQIVAMVARSAKASGQSLGHALQTLMPEENRDFPLADYIPALARVYNFPEAGIRAFLAKLATEPAGG